MILNGELERMGRTEVVIYFQLTILEFNVGTEENHENLCLV